MRINIYILTLLISTSAIAQEQSVIGLGWAGNSVNTVVFRHNSLVSDNQFQFAAYYDSTGHVVLAKRKLGAKTWEVKQTALTGNIMDAHNTISIMVDGEGYLHVSWDHHNNPVNYCRSVTPGSLDLTDKLAMTGKEESSVSYPEFYRLPDGDMLFLYRNGASGRGNLVLNHYYTKTKTWERVQSNLIDGEGERSPYWQACVDAKGIFHISWVWRETPDVASNHDILYAKSPDGGKTWQRSNNEPQPMPINAANAENVVHIAQRSELINSTSMCTNAAGHIFIATYWRAGFAASPQYRLIWFDGSRWDTQEISDRKTAFSLSGAGTKKIPLSRPQVLAQGKKVYMIFRDAERGNFVSVSYNNNISKGEWKTIDISKQPVGQWEPSYDTELWRRKSIINIYMQLSGQGDGEKTEKIPAQEVSVLEWKP
jgi:hypothetical protein